MTTKPSETETKTAEHDTDVDHEIPEPAAPERGMRLTRDRLPARLDSPPIEAAK